jgi:hypothetical protein
LAEQAVCAASIVDMQHAQDFCAVALTIALIDIPCALLVGPAAVVLHSLASLHTDVHLTHIQQVVSASCSDQILECLAYQGDVFLGLVSFDVGIRAFVPCFEQICCFLEL